MDLPLSTQFLVPRFCGSPSQVYHLSRGETCVSVDSNLHVLLTFAIVIKTTVTMDFSPEKEHGKSPDDDVENLPHSDVPRPTQQDLLQRSLSARQVQMIAIGGTIGTGLFLGTGKSLATGGPASILIAYAIVGAIVFTTMLALGEMAAFIPVAGSFCTFAG